MIDMLQNAKDLIAKGKVLGDPELIQMGMDLLNEYNPNQMAEVVEANGGFREVSKVTDEPQEPQYICANCGYTMSVDKAGRKKCPECKKHQLELVNPTMVEEDSPYKPAYNELLEAFQNQQTAAAPQSLEQFHMQVRAGQHNRIHYDEQGNPDGVIRKIEQVDPSQIHNQWEDSGEDREDRANELLKKFTKCSPRTRAPVNYVEVQCENCKKTSKVHPIHVGGRGRYLCDKCVRRRSGR